MKSKALRPALAALVGTMVASMGSAHPVLSFDETLDLQAPKGANFQSSKRDMQVSVTLGHRYLIVDSPGSREIFDFETHQRYHLDLTAKTYNEFSLFAQLGFAVIESQNRVLMNRMLSAAKLLDDMRSPPMVEQLFSVAVPGGDADIDTAKADGGTVYRWRGHDLLSISDASQPLPAEYQREYWRWLRINFGGHPKIYTDLKERSGVPKLLRIVRPDNGVTTVALRLRSVANSSTAVYTLEGFSRTTPNAEPYLTLHHLDGDSSAALAVQISATRGDMESSIAAAKGFDAFLAFMALTNAATDAASMLPPQATELFRSDANAKAVAAVMQAHTKEQAESAVKTLSELRGQTTANYAYMLDVFAANHELDLRRTQDAERHFLAALAKNPYLTGAWFDLGNVYYATFRTPEAWACWDTARALNPKHPLRHNVDALEQRLLTEWPQLF
jgi:tetratricopeptide (TPR) repeat protein